MAEYTAVSKKIHAVKRWHRSDSYYFAAGEQTAPLVAAEFPRACLSFPIAWIDNGGSYEPVALLGLVESQNLFVDAALRWLADYVPAHFRAQPFRLIATDPGQYTLGVREDIGLVTDNGSGNPFFNDSGELSELLQQVVVMLRKLESNRAATQTASDALVDAGLLKPWDLSSIIDGERCRLHGLFHVSQQGLNNLDAETLADLRDKGALAMAYCQQVSQRLIKRLEMLHERRIKEKVKRTNHPADQGSFGLGFDEGEGGISFGGMADNDD